MKKKCLIIIPGIPFPPVDGHKLKIYNLIKILSKKYDLHIVTISKTKLNEQEQDFINTHSYKNAHFKLNLIGAGFRILKNIFSPTPFQVAYFTLNAVKKYLKVNTESDDLVVFNLVRTAGYLPLLKSKKIVFDMVDLLSKSYFKSGISTSSRLFRLIYKIEGKRLLAYERIVMRNSELTLCVNNDDAIALKPYGDVIWLPNGVKDHLFDYQEFDKKYKNSIVFFGAMFYQPNIDAVIWFDKYVMDHLNKDITLYIIGARPSRQIINLANKRKNIIVTGFLEDPYIILNSCFAVIAPMQNGGGIQNKILEVMGMGKINILTSYGANPILGAKDKEHFFVEDNALAMAERINDIFVSDENCRDIGAKAKQLILDNYTWDAYEKKILAAFVKLDI